MSAGSPKPQLEPREMITAGIVRNHICFSGKKAVYLNGFFLNGLPEQAKGEGYEGQLRSFLLSFDVSCFGECAPRVC